jgi:hypothetical protein
VTNQPVPHSEPPDRPTEPSGVRDGLPRHDDRQRSAPPPAPDAGGWDEQVWRRPSWTDEPPAPTAPSEAYAGPPRSEAPDATWRPPTMIQVPRARELPSQDDAAIDAQERQARTVTYGVGMITGAVALIMLIILCGHVLF